MKHLALAIFLPLLAACGFSDRTAAGLNLDQCRLEIVPRQDSSTRSQTITVPERFQQIVASGPGRLGVLKLDGLTTCVDASWVSNISDMEYLEDERLIGWQWEGYELFGYRLVDRQSGQILDTGDRPYLSPNRQRIAAFQVSESGWGGLEGLGIWQVSDVGLQQLFLETDMNPGASTRVFTQNLGPWSFEGWSGEDCVNLSVKPLDIFPPDPRGIDARNFHSAAANGWEIHEGTCR